MSKKFFSRFSVILLLVLACIFTVTVVKATDKKQQIEKYKNTLLSEGVRPADIWTDETVLHVSLYASNDDSLGAEDILALRLARNEARLMIAGKEKAFKGIVSINNIFIDSNGSTLYDATIQDFITVPQDFTESVRLFGEVPNLSEKETTEALSESMKESELPWQIQEIAINPLGGYVVKMYMDQADSRKDISAINSIIQETVLVIDKLNEKGSSISEYRLTVADPDNAQTIYVMDADLIYRDFLWWQSPALGNEPWTGSSPKQPE